MRSIAFNPLSIQMTKAPLTHNSKYAHLCICECVCVRAVAPATLQRSTPTTLTPQCKGKSSRNAMTHIRGLQWTAQRADGLLIALVCWTWTWQIHGYVPQCRYHKQLLCDPCYPFCAPTMDSTPTENCPRLLLLLISAWKCVVVLVVVVSAVAVAVVGVGCFSSLLSLATVTLLLSALF